MAHIMRCVLFIAAAILSSGFAADQKSGYNGTCLYDSDCGFNNSFCLKREFCDCRRGYNYDEETKTCQQNECSTDYECDNYEYTHCKNGVCACNKDYIRSKRKTMHIVCLPVAHYNESCTEEHQCQTLKTSCQNGRCLCSKGLAWTSASCTNSAVTSKAQLHTYTGSGIGV
ncbi:hypothetical protein C0J52_09110 [Blattella germanica]|nr:hypothetical protein C0J52_09110 [Blattella germanica]